MQIRLRSQRFILRRNIAVEEPRVSQQASKGASESMTKLHSATKMQEEGDERIALETGFNSRVVETQSAASY